MKGSLILERIKDPQLRHKWHNHLDQLHSALDQLNKVRRSPTDEPSELEYIEAVLRFAEARDDERNFFWDTFVEERVDDRQLRA
jgi:hypothetical protein